MPFDVIDLERVLSIAARPVRVRFVLDDFHAAAWLVALFAALLLNRRDIAESCLANGNKNPWTLLRIEQGRILIEPLACESLVDVIVFFTYIYIFSRIIHAVGNPRSLYSLFLPPIAKGLERQRRRRAYFDRSLFSSSSKTEKVITYHDHIQLCDAVLVDSHRHGYTVLLDEHDALNNQWRAPRKEIETLKMVGLLLVIEDPLWIGRI